MAIVEIKIKPEEKEMLLKSIAAHKGVTISLTKLARHAKQNPNRARYVMEELIQDGTVEKVVVKQFNDKYKRYQYNIIKAK